MGVSRQDAAKGLDAAWQFARTTKRTSSAFWGLAWRTAGASPELFSLKTVAACEKAIAAGLRRTFPETLKTAQRAKAAGVAVGMISNHIVSPDWFVSCERGAGLCQLVSHPSLLIVSQEVGLAKPDAAIYARFFSALVALYPGVQPSQLVFVDDKQKNVDAAVALGWHGLCFDARKARPGDLATRLQALGCPC